MAITKLNSGQRRFQDAKGMFVTPYTADGLLGANTYDIHDIVGDTLSITADDADKTEIPWEFGDDPLDENVKLGKKNFTCQCLDFQNDIMKVLFGCTVDTNGTVMFPSEYKDLYVMIRVEFADVDLVLPYVKMDAKATLENMRTDIARGELSGTIMSHDVIVSAKPTAEGQNAHAETSTPTETPMLFLKPSYAAYVVNAIESNGTKTYATEYFEKGTSSTSQG